MDLKRNEYAGLDVADTAGFASVVEDWPGPAIGVPDEAGVQTLRELFEAGLLVSCSPTDAPATPMSFPEASAALIDGYVDVATRTSLLDIVRFAYASTVAWSSLKWRPLEATLARNRRRRERLRRRVEQLTVDQRLERLAQLTTAFERMRTFLFTARDRCLFDSLALSEFLACYGLAPDWIFGVTTQPFSAHCWLQDGDVVINDTPDHTRTFTPILSV